MKFSQTLLAALPFLQLSAAVKIGGMVGFGWSVDDIPEEGLKDIVFPMDISGSPHQSGFYFAQQFNFINQDNVGYTGLQPREDVNGQPLIHAVFSSFNAATSDDENCSDGADGGVGLSCAVEFVGPYENQYYLHIENTEGTTWVGTVVDAVKGNGTRIGTFTLGSGAKGIAEGQLGFVEAYGIYDGKDEHVCTDIPKHTVVFGEPIAKGYTGHIGTPYQYGDCADSQNFETHTHSDGGVSITVGF